MSRIVNRAVCVALVAAAALAGAVTSVSAQTPESQPPPVRYTYEIGVSSVPMIRNAQVFTLAGALADRGADAALDGVFGSLDEKQGAKGVLGRIARLWFVDMPIASLAVVGNHEFGHVVRVGWPSDYMMHVTQWPWPAPMPGLEVTSLTPPPNPLWVLSPIAGGIEADFVNAERSLDRMYDEGAASPYDMVQFTYAKAHRSLYVLLGYDGGDPANYTFTLAFMHLGTFDAPDSATIPEFGRIRSSMRKGAWFNLLDYALVANVERVVIDHIGRGDPVLEPSWLKAGRLRFVPSANYLFTPRGPQYQVGSRIRMAGGVGNAYVRWTQALQVDYVALDDFRFTPQVPFRVRLFGAGVQLRSTSRRTIAPTVSLDAWRDVDGHGGCRVEFGGTLRMSSLGPRSAIRFAVGGKTVGYLPGFPDAPGLYVNGGLVVSF